MKLTIIFYYPAPLVFNDASYEAEGVGGSEASLILVSRELARLGHDVTVYNNTPQPGRFHGVQYRPFASFSPSQPVDLFVLFRAYQDDVLRRVRAAVKLFWTCDQYPTGEWKDRVLPFVDAVLAISPFHKRHLVEQHGAPAERIEVLDLGIQQADYAVEGIKVPGKLLYCSVPNRGLKYLAALLPRIRQRVPQAELWITSDFRLWGMEAGNEVYARLFSGLEGVHFLGKIGRAELVRQQLTAQVLAYPCDWPENFCISALECLAAGTVPVTTDLAALETTVADCGIRLPGLPRERDYQERFVAEVVELLQDEEYRRSYEDKGRRRALDGYGWERVVASQWEPLFARLLERQRSQEAHDHAFSTEPAGWESHPPSRGRPWRVSLTAIVKNEEANLPTCLGSVVDLVDEIIVVDTGSTDRTKDVAARFGARVVDFPWVDSFAAARNESLRHATGDWILWLDGDESFDADNRLKLRALLDRLGRDNVAYVMRQHSAPPGSKTTGTVVHQARLFPNHAQVRWEYRIHEQILPALGRLRTEQRFIDIDIAHSGYEDPALVKSKIERNLRLILMENAEHPDDPFTLFNLGWAYLSLDRAAEALPILQRSLERAPAGASIVHKLYALLATAHSKLGQPAAALAACRAGLARGPGDAELLFLQGMLLEEGGDLAGAERCFAELVPESAGPLPGVAGVGTSFPVGSGMTASVFGTPTFGSLELGRRGVHARHHLAAIYQKLGRPAEAETHWQALLAENPDHVPAWLQLGELYLGQQRWPELEGVLGRLQSLPPALAGALLQARMLLARHDLTAARRLLEEIVARAPQAVPPRVLLSRLLWHDGQDPKATEQALRQVLALDPGQVEVWQQLVVLLGRGHRVVDALLACGTARTHHPRDPELLLLEGHLCVDLGQPADAERRFLALLEQPSAASNDVRAQRRRGQARHQLALIYHRQRRPGDAEAQWRALLREEPHDADAWRRLGELWLGQERWAEVEQAAGQLANGVGAEQEATILRARVHLARREFEPARALLEAAIARDPLAEGPRTILSYVYLQAGLDPAATERTLRDVLVVNPNNAEARHNLTVLLRERGRAAVGT